MRVGEGSAGPHVSYPLNQRLSAYGDPVKIARRYGLTALARHACVAGALAAVAITVLAAPIEASATASQRAIGEARAQDPPSVGTTVEVTLPATPDAPPSAPAPTMVQPTGQEEAGQEKAGQEKAAVSPWVTGIVGVIGGVSGAAVTQAGGLYLSRTQRRGDRKITRLESLIKDFEVLDCAIEAANVDDPSPEANRELTVALRKFERTVALIAEKDLRDHATECAKLTLKFAVTRNEPDEEGPTQQEVSDAHTELMERVRKVADSTV